MPYGFKILARKGVRTAKTMSYLLIVDDGGRTMPVLKVCLGWLSSPMCEFVANRLSGSLAFRRHGITGTPSGALRVVTH